MLLNEQLIFRKGRIFYHGSPYNSIKEENAKWPYFFITTNLFYAIYYAKRNNEGYNTIYEIHIKKPLNIFNARSMKDLEDLKNIKDLKLTDKKIGDLQNKDWLTFKWISRDELVKIIKYLGFDGFFNFEYDSFNYPKEEMMPSFSRTSLGIFDISNLSFVKDLKYYELKQINKEFSDAIDQDIKLLPTRIRQYKSSKTLQKLDIYDWLYNSSKFLPMEEIKRWKDDIEKSLGEKSEKLKLPKSFKEILKESLQLNDILDEYKLS